MLSVRPGRWLPAVALVVLLPAAAPAQVKYPANPETVAVEFRYRIRAEREERVREFTQMTKNLDAAGFKRDVTGELEPELDIFDPAAERMRGTVPYAGLGKMLADPRIKTILFRPTDFAVPADPDQRVAVRLGITVGFTPTEQERFHGQVVAQLARLGFRELVGYDPRGFTLVRGDLPAGNLMRLVRDLRTEPAGWLVPDSTPDQLPAPMRDVLPVRLVQVLPVTDPAPFTPPALAPNRAAYAPGLRAVLDDMAAANQPLRVEVVTTYPLTGGDLDRLRTKLFTEYSRLLPDPATKRSELRAAAVEGAAGNVLTVRFLAPADAERFAAEPFVAYLRLPRPAAETASPAVGGPAPNPSAALAAAGLDRFRQAGGRGTGLGTKVVVIGTAFPGLTPAKGGGVALGDGGPPVGFLDLTAELSADLLPAPNPDAAQSTGTAAARAARLAAPQADLVLVRVDPASFFQVLTVARFARGDAAFSDAMQTRVAELTLRTEDVRRRLAQATLEYQAAIGARADDPRAEARRDAALKAFAAAEAEQADLSGAIARATTLQRDMTALAGATVVVNTLVWDAGVPMDGMSALSRYIDLGYAGEASVEPINRSASRPRLSPRPVWVQAASPLVGSVWAGPFSDANGNARAEFAPASVALPNGEWTRELNFLAARADDGTTTDTLKAGTKVRLTVQWRETHDPTAYGGFGAILPLTVRVFQQLDPTGQTRASDELKEVARPVGGPYPLVVEPTYGIYEQVVEFAVPEDGRYGVMLEGREAFDPRLPALRRAVQVTPRLVAEFVGSAGRPVFASYAPVVAGVGAPADARSAVAVAAAGGPQLTGAGPGVALLTKPDLYADGALGGGFRGNGPAAGFVAGGLAALVGSGAPASDLFRTIGLQRGTAFAVPDGWLRRLPSR